MIRRLTIHFALAVAFGGSAMAADAAYLAKSREIRGGQAPVEISVDVTGVDVLELVATGYYCNFVRVHIGSHFRFPILFVLALWGRRRQAARSPGLLSSATCQIQSRLPSSRIQ